jgi:hypothetical protein
MLESLSFSTFRPTIASLKDHTFSGERPKGIWIQLVGIPHSLGPRPSEAGASHVVKSLLEAREVVLPLPDGVSVPLLTAPLLTPSASAIRC